MEMGEDLPHLPPGFRFHPSDEELIIHYLLNKVKQHPLPASIIGEINLYNFDPWVLPEKALFGNDKWYFFTPRDKKYPNGTRPNRSAGSGYWKATGKDKPIFGFSGLRIGVKKSLVFFTGSPTTSIKTNWIMTEYRLPESSNRSPGSMRLDDWVLCMIRQKGNNSNNISQVQELPSPYMITNTNLEIVSNRRLREIQIMASILVGQGIPPLT